MKRTMFALLVAVLLPAMVGATTITYVSGPANLTGSNTGTAGSLAAPWTIAETFTGVGPVVLRFNSEVVTAVVSPVGPGNQTGTGHTAGRWIEKTVTNNTQEPWTTFEVELQAILGTPSGQGDGLSFADGSLITGSFWSDIFSTYTRIDTTRDYLNFSGGTVLAGDSVIFRFAITDNGPNDPFWLLETPNRADVPEPASMVLLGTGLVGLATRLRRRK